MFERENNLRRLYKTRKYLRNNLTDHEVILWNRLKNSGLGFKFRRQHSIGNFVVDFYCSDKKLVIELDGSQHLDMKEYDKERTEYLNSLGVKVIRFWNKDIDSDLVAVLDSIRRSLSQ